MKKIVLISDNHSYFGNEIMAHLEAADEIWHAGDIGTLASIEPLMEFAVFRGVYGNIDDQTIKFQFPLDQIFHCEGLKIYMTHIGGYPGRYNSRAYQVIKNERPNVFICGHSHICKVMPDKANNLLHMNPGAYGHHGFHKIRTILRFEIHASKIQNLRVIELGMRGQISPEKQTDLSL